MGARHPMPFKQYRRQITTATLSIAVLSVIYAMTAEASRPVRRVMIGCVVNGTLVNQNGYRLRVRNGRTRAPVDLSRYEGRQIRFNGSLLPGDIFYVNEAPAVLGRCPATRRR